MIDQATSNIKDCGAKHKVGGADFSGFIIVPLFLIHEELNAAELYDFPLFEMVTKKGANTVKKGIIILFISSHIYSDKKNAQAVSKYGLPVTRFRIGDWCHIYLFFLVPGTQKRGLFSF